MKKILFIHQWHSIGGSGVSLYNTWKSLANDYNVITYVPSKPAELLDYLDSKGLHPKTYPFTCGQFPYYSGGSSFYKPGFWYLLFLSFTQVKYWKKIVELENPDIICVNSKVLCWMGKIFSNRTSLCFVRETIRGNPNSIINRIMKRMLEKFSLVSFLSEYDLIQTGLKKAKSFVAPDFLSMDEYLDKYGKEAACRILNTEVDKINIAFVGGVNRLKGIEIALQSLNQLKNENIRLLVAGQDIGQISQIDSNNMISKMLNKKSHLFSSKIKSYIESNNLLNNVRFIGVQKDISILYSASDFLIFPMKDPHQARPAFEIGVQKKPVIITDFPNIREFVRDRVNGLTFMPDDSQSLAEAIRSLISDSQLIMKLGLANYDYTLHYHTEEYAMGIIKSQIENELQNRGIGYVQK